MTDAEDAPESGIRNPESGIRNPDDPPMPELAEAVYELAEAAQRLRKLAAAEAAKDPGDREPLEGYLGLLLELRDAQDAAAEAKATLAEVANGLMPWRDVHVPGLGGPFRRTGGWTRKWDVEGALDWLLVLARRLRVRDQETSEVESDGEALRRLLPRVAHVDYLKMREIESLGGQADEFVTEKKPVRPGVSLPRRLPDRLG